MQAQKATSESHQNIRIRSQPKVDFTLNSFSDQKWDYVCHLGIEIGESKKAFQLYLFMMWWFNDIASHLVSDSFFPSLSLEWDRWNVPLTSSVHQNVDVNLSSQTRGDEAHRSSDILWECWLEDQSFEACLPDGRVEIRSEVHRNLLYYGNDGSGLSSELFISIAWCFSWANKENFLVTPSEKRKVCSRRERILSAFHHFQCKIHCLPSEQSLFRFLFSWLLRLKRLRTFFTLNGEAKKEQQLVES